MSADRFDREAGEIVAVWQDAGLLNRHSALPAYITALANDLRAARMAGIEEALLAVAEEGLNWPEGTGGREGIKRACAAIRALKRPAAGEGKT